MDRFIPQDPDFRARVQDSFARQTFMETLGAFILRIDPGICEIGLAFRRDLCQQHGYLHAGITTTIADNAAGYAAYSLMPADSSVLTAEFKANFLAPASGDRLVARAEVMRPGRTLTVVRAEVFATTGERETCVAAMLATLVCLERRSDLAGGQDARTIA